MNARSLIGFVTLSAGLLACPSVKPSPTLSPTSPAVSAVPLGPDPSAAPLGPSDQSLMRAAADSKQVFVGDLTTLVNIDSGTDDSTGLAQVSDFLAQRLTKLGAAVEVLSAPPAAGNIVRGTFQGTGTKAIMLMVHFDTVFGKGEAARRPFKVEGNRAFKRLRFHPRRHQADRLRVTRAAPATSPPQHDSVFEPPTFRGRHSMPFSIWRFSSEAFRVGCAACITKCSVR